VVAVSYPLQFLTERIVGDSIKVEMPVPKEVDPQNWQPTRDAIATMQSADLIIANGNGATYANWLTTVSLPDSKLCFSATRGLSLSDYIPVEDVQVVHSHGPEGEHSHATMVARSWLDPAIAKKQSIYIAERLKNVYPDLSDQFDRNMKTLAADLDELTARMDQLKQEKSPAVISANPRVKFFTRAAGVNDQHLIWFELPSAEVAKSDLETLLAKIPEPQPTLILFPNEAPGIELTNVLTDAGLKPVLIDLVDQKPATGDFLTALRANIERFAAARKGD
jgi:zinc transport system substrate-binding protein